MAEDHSHHPGRGAAATQRTVEQQRFVAERGGAAATGAGQADFTPARKIVAITLRVMRPITRSVMATLRNFRAEVKEHVEPPPVFSAGIDIFLNSVLPAITLGIIQVNEALCASASFAPRMPGRRVAPVTGAVWRSGGVAVRAQENSEKQAVSIENRVRQPWRTRADRGGLDTIPLPK